MQEKDALQSAIDNDPFWHKEKTQTICEVAPRAARSPHLRLSRLSALSAPPPLKTRPPVPRARARGLESDAVAGLCLGWACGAADLRGHCAVVG